MKRFSIAILFLSLFLSIYAERKFPIPMIDDKPLNYVCYKSKERLVIDGKLDEESWKLAAWTEEFVDIEGHLKPLPPFITKAKMLWDDEYFYIGAYMEETDLWATLTERDAVIYFDNDFEVFIDPDGDTHDYYEIEVNAFNTVWDLFLIKPYRDRAQVAIDAWDVKGLKTAVYLKGTLNDPSDVDDYWTVEMAIPWAVLKEAAHKETPPVEGDIWKVNFSRVHWQLDKTDDGYVKSINSETGRHYPEMNIVWSPQGLIAMHYPEMWGDVSFTHTYVGEDKIEFTPDPLRFEKKYLRKIYYEQKEYFLQNGKFAQNLKTLNIKPIHFEGYKKMPEIHLTPNTYQIILKSVSDKPDLHIFSDGRLIDKIDFH